MPRPPAAGSPFAAVRAARLTELPTRRRVLSRCGIAVLGAAVSFLTWLTAVELGSAVAVALAAAATLATVHQAVRAVRTARAPGRRRPATDGLDRLGEHWLAGAGEALPAALARDWDGVAETMAEVAAEALAGSFRGRKRRHVTRLRELLGAAPGDPVLLACRGVLGPDWWARALLPLTFGLAAPLMLRTVAVSLAAGRLTVHPLRRGRLGTALVDAPLEQVRVCEWFQGRPPLESRHSVLVVAHGDRRARVAFPLFWREEAQLLFDVLHARDLARAVVPVSAASA